MKERSPRPSERDADDSPTKLSRLGRSAFKTRKPRFGSEQPTEQHNAAGRPYGRCGIKYDLRLTVEVEAARVGRLR